MARLAPKQSVVRRLFALSGNQCAFPDCKDEMIDEEGEFIGQICHIEAAEIGGERFNENQSDEDRRSFKNLLLLCYRHHVKTNDVMRYPTSTLAKIKEDHEKKFLQDQYELPIATEQKILDLNLEIKEIHETVTNSAKQLNVLSEASIVANDKTHEMLKNLLSIAGNINSISSDTDIHSTQLDFIKDLKNRGKAQTALEELQRYRSENWQAITPELKYKVIANIASIFLEIGKKHDAGLTLKELEDVDYKSIESVCYQALGYAITDDTERFEAIFNSDYVKNSNNINLWIGFIHIKSPNKSANEIELQIPKAILDKKEIKFTLGEVYLDEGDTDKGFRMLNEGISLSGKQIEDTWKYKAVVAEKKLVYLASLEKIAYNNFSVKDLELIESCIRELTEVWDYVVQTEFSNAWSHIVMNRGIAYKILGDVNNAEKDLENAWNLDNNFNSFKNLVFQYFEYEQYDRAIRLINLDGINLLAGYSKIEFVSIKARYFILTKEVDVAVHLLNTELEGRESHDRLYLSDLIIVALFEEGAFAKALPYALQVMAEFPQMPHGFLSASICYRRMDNNELALINLDVALEKARKTEGHDWIWYQLGIEFSGFKKYTEAIECLEKLHSPGISNPLNRKLLLVYFYAGEYNKAEDQCKAIVTNNRYDTVANEILLRIYEATGRFEDVKVLLEEFLLFGDAQAHDHFRLLGIKFYKRLGDNDKLKQLLLAIQDASRYDLLEQFIVARMMLECFEVDRGMQIAYDARLDNYECSEAHQYFIQIQIGRPQESREQQFPSEVNLECAVELINIEGTKSTFFLTDDSRLFGQNILRSSDELTKLLMNKVIGNKVEMPNSIGVGNLLTINAIINRNVYAYEESLKLLETKFTGSTGIVFYQQEDSNKNEFKNYLFQQNIESNRRREEILRTYNTGATTISMLADLFNRNIIEMWIDMIHDSSIGIQCYSHDESADLEWALENSSPAVLDPIAILTYFGLLNAPGILGNLFSKIIISQSTLDEFIDYQTQLNNPQPKATLFIENGELCKSVSQPENLAKQIEWINDLINWCKSNTTILAPIRTIVYDTENAGLKEIIGQAYYDTLQLSLEQNGILICDDDKLKQLAFGEHQLRSVSVFQLLMHGTRNNMIKAEEYSNFSKALIRSNYCYLPLSGEDLWALFDESGFKIGTPFIQGTRSLIILSPEYAARTIAYFAKQVYLNIVLPHMRDQILLFTISMLKRHGEYSKIKKILPLYLEHSFKLLLEQKMDFLQIIKNA